MAYSVAAKVRGLYDKTHWFTDAEGWAVFRFFAIAEAIGWTLLIGAIVYRALGLPQAPSVISFAGHMHGIFYIFYFVIVCVVARSMEWGLKGITLAIVAGMPPYGSLLFERIVSARRKKFPVFIAPPAGSDE